jgi:hypothetical protein
VSGLYISTHHHQPTTAHYLYTRSSVTCIQLLSAVLRKSSLHLLRASYTSFIETRSPLKISFTSAVVGSTVNPLPLQRVNTVCYVGDFSFLPDHLLSDPIPQRNPEQSSFHSSLSDLELVDQPCRECPRLGSVCQHNTLYQIKPYY